jgi:predicted DNA-binding protein (UPF0251 family)
MNQGRPKKKRRIVFLHNDYYYKPRGVPLGELEEISVPLDEIEAIRLADFLGKTHATAAKKMKISRSTFSRLIRKARNKIAEAIIEGKAIKVETEIPEKKIKQNLNADFL